MKKITCNYGTTFTLSVVEVQKQPVLEINFNIKTYKVCNSGWKTFDFPPDIVMNDKLYISQEMIPYIVAVLDHFIETGELDSPTGVEYTNRGFSLLKLEDINGSCISIQQSSAASAPYIWFGGVVDTDKIYQWKNNELEKFIFPEHDTLINDRLHLSIKKVNQLKLAIHSEWEKYNKNNK